MHFEVMMVDVKGLAVAPEVRTNEFVVADALLLLGYLFARVDAVAGGGGERASFLIEAVLGTLHQALDTPIIANPLNDYNSDDTDLARIYKYKLTEREIPPWFFQNSNIEIFPIIFVYL